MANDVAIERSGIDGLGVFAERPFRQDEVVLAIDDSRVVDDDFPLCAGEEERHCDFLENGRVVFMQPPERHINHSCDPNTYVKTRNGKRLVIARREIAAGEEITYDYCINGSGATVWFCHCGAMRCRHEIHSDYFHLPIEIQQEYLPLLDDWFKKEEADKVERFEHRLSKS